MAEYRNAVGALLRTSAVPANHFSAAFDGQTLVGTGAAEAFWGKLALATTLVGGDGDDSYGVSNARTAVVEGAGGGVDTATVWGMDYVLPSNVENLVANGGAQVRGNGLDNVLRGDAYTQTLNGGGGNDVLIGGGGGDTFVVTRGNGSDVIVDLKGSEGDAVRLIGYGFRTFDDVRAASRQVGADVVVDLGAGEILVLRDKTLDNLTPAQVQLPLVLDGARLAFADEFDAVSLRSEDPSGIWKTSMYWGGRTFANNNERQYYVDPSYRGLGLNPFEARDGVLTITARPADAEVRPLIEGRDYTSGFLSSQMSFAMQYGYFEIRAQLPAGQGLWPAFWLVPVDGSWPPELDVMESLGHDTGAYHATLHSTQTGSHVVDGHSIPVADSSDGFHTYGVDWRRDTITFYLDGMAVLTRPTPADMHKPMYMIANLAVGGNWPGDPDATTPFPAQLRIDHVRAFLMPSDHAAVPVPAGWRRLDPATAFSSLDGSGARTVWDRDHVMPEGQVKTRLSGDWTRTIAGNALDNYVEGSAAAYNEIRGGGGRDVLRGGAGVDTFVIRNGEGNDTILDLSNAPGDADKVQLEGFHFTHFDDVRAWMTQVGADTMLRLDEDQALLIRNRSIADLSPEQFVFLETVPLPPAANAPPSPKPAAPSTGAWTATVAGTTGADALSGGDGNDLMDGRSGADRLSGAGGDDTYRVDHAGDAIAEWAGAGIDLVESYVAAYALPNHVENLILAGSGVQSGTGNALDNRLMANRGGSTLDGGDGHDALYTGAGLDVLTGGTGRDVFVLRRLSGGPDRVTDFQPGADAIDLRPVVKAIGYAGADPVSDGTVQVRAGAAGGTELFVDADGWGGTAAVHVLTVDHVDPGLLRPQADWFWA